MKLGMGLLTVLHAMSLAGLLTMANLLLMTSRLWQHSSLVTTRLQLHTYGCGMKLLLLQPILCSPKCPGASECLLQPQNRPGLSL